jgi:hypothetical protein
MAKAKIKKKVKQTKKILLIALISAAVLAGLVV